MIIHASMRTDIPAFYSEWFTNRIREGYVRVRNPYDPLQVTEYSLDPEVVDLIVFCSKNPVPMLKYMDLLTLCYCLGINGDTRKNADRIYNFKTGSVKTKCLHEGWQTSGSLKVVRMAFNLYCNSTPSVWDYEDAEEQVNECRQYTVEDIFCCAYAPYFWQAIQIRYPEYVVYNQKLHAMLGGID